MNLKFIDMKFILLVSILIIISILYGMYKDKTVLDDDQKHYNIVREYLLNDNPLANKKPIIWIHLDYKINARDWLSFNSRNTHNLNQPYLYLTIKSIIDKCGEDFNICLIDDNSFVNILQDWSIELNMVAEPMKYKLRQLALAKILYNYGGFYVSPSFFCSKNLKQLFDKHTKDDNMFGGDLINNNITSHDNNLYVNNLFLGCKRNCSKMLEYCNHIQFILQKDYTSESDFTGIINSWLEDNIKNNNINVINAENLGFIDSNNKIITLDNLLNNSYIDLHDNAFGIYIPSNEILMRKKYQWFARLSPRQVLESNTFIGKYMVINIEQEEKEEK